LDIDSHRHHGGTGGLFMSQEARVKDSVSFDLTGSVTIIGDVEITDDVKIFTHKHDYKGAKKKRHAKIIVKDLVIENDVTIGNNAIIICIDSIGEGAVIGAGSVVTKNIPKREIWAGNPARKIGER